MIKKYRLAQNMTQEELAEKLGISWRHLQRLERDERNMRLSLFKKVVKTLNVSDDEILKYIKKRW